MKMGSDDENAPTASNNVSHEIHCTAGGTQDILPLCLNLTAGINCSLQPNVTMRVMIPTDELKILTHDVNLISLLRMLGQRKSTNPFLN